MPPSCHEGCTNRSMETSSLQSNGFVYEKIHVSEKASKTVVANLEGTLLRSRDPFAYYFLLAMEAGSPIRALLLLVLFPVVWCCWHLFRNEAVAYQILIFVSTAGLKLPEVEGVSKAVLTKFFLEDLHSESYRLFTACGKRYVISSIPRIMAEYFLKAHVGVNEVFGTELDVTEGGYCTGFVSGSGVLLAKGKADIVKKLFQDSGPALGLGSCASDYPFLCLCKENVIVQSGKNVDAVPRDQYLSPLVFHDGRLSLRPTPLTALAIFLWFPAGILLALVRLMLSECLPMEIGFAAGALSGFVIRIKGAPPVPNPEDQDQNFLFACSHRSLLDPAFLAMGLRRKVTAVAYSVSKLSQFLSIIKTVILTRNRKEDALVMKGLLEKEDVCVCPEGTTGREPYLLRFSALFAELSENIVPVAMRTRTSMFHGTTARGNKAWDSFFLMMDPRPLYEVSILDQLPKEQTVAGGKTAVEVATFVQQKLANELGFKCTNLTRRDKYTVLAGHNGTVKDGRSSAKSS